MTSVTSFTRTPRGLPRDQWAPCRIEDETSSLLCGRPTDPSFSQVSQKREGNLCYIISLLSIIQEEIQHLFFSFFLPSKNRSKIRVMREKGGGAGGFFEKLLESYHVFPRFRRPENRRRRRLYCGVSMPPGARRRGWRVRKGEERWGEG